MPNIIDTIDFGDGVERQLACQGDITSISVNGTAQTISSGEVDLDIVSNLITESQWTSLQSLWSIEIEEDVNENINAT